MQKVVTSSNLNPSLKLFFYSPILTNNNLLLKIYYENIVKILQQHFSIRIFYFLYYFSFFHFTFNHTFYFFFFFFFFFSSTRCPLSLPLFYSSFLPHSPSFIRTFQELFLSLAPLSLFFFLLDSKTLSVIRKFSFPPSFKNILGSSHLRVVAHLRLVQMGQLASVLCLFFFFFFAFIVMI